MRTLRKKIIKATSSKKNKAKEWLYDVAARYNVEDFNPHNKQKIAELLKRVDIIPVELALVQAANESAWGTSRFARTGNNFFGQWCFKKGCGIIPARRVKGHTHEVRKFDDPYESVASYIHNLNTHPYYQKLRTLRATLREKNNDISGKALAKGLSRYSIRGKAYVKELQAMMRVNKGLINKKAEKKTKPTKKNASRIARSKALGKTLAAPSSPQSMQVSAYIKKLKAMMRIDKGLTIAQCVKKTQSDSDTQS